MHRLLPNWLVLALLLPAVASGEGLDAGSMRIEYDPAAPLAALRLTNTVTGTVFAMPTRAAEPLLANPQSLSVVGGRLRIDYEPLSVGAVSVQARRLVSGDPTCNLARIETELTITASEPAATQASAWPLLERVTVLDAPLPGQPTLELPGWQSYPVFTEDLFFGIEFPVGSAKVVDGRIVLSQCPAKRLEPGKTLTLRPIVIGAAPAGRVREAFEAYVSSFRPGSGGVHFNYNSWWTTPVPFSEADVLKLTAEFREKLFARHGVSFDTFTIDLGWSQRDAIWRVDPGMFPDGFEPLNRELHAQQAELGLWWSPSNFYTPASFDNGVAAGSGYETIPPGPGNPTGLRLLCLAKGAKSQREVRDRLAELSGTWKLGQSKFDGYWPNCPQADHGHPAGELSCELVAEGLIEVFEAMRAASPDMWMETTCFGFDASPWWLRWVNSVIGPFGDDAPPGNIPAPSFRESYTSARDFFNLRGAITPVPIAAQEVLGIIHQTSEPMYNDAITTVARGHQFISLYLNPRYMADQDYSFLAELMTWARSQAPMLARTRIIWPRDWRASGPGPVNEPWRMPRQTYGYAHWHEGQGLICLRNPWMAEDTIELRLDEQTLGGTPAGRLEAWEIYPGLHRISGHLEPGQNWRVAMKPYQTRLIQLIPAGGETATEEAGTPPLVKGEPVVRSRFVRLRHAPAPEPSAGDDYTVISSAEQACWEATMSFEGRAGQLYLLAEDRVSAEPTATISVNGQAVQPAIHDAAAGWAAAVPHFPRTNWRWFVIPLAKGQNDIQATVNLPGGMVGQVSAWLVSTAPPVRTNHPPEALGSLPPAPPGGMELRSHPLILPTPVPTRGLEEVVRAPVIERIRGIYLDRLEPVSHNQGWGTLRRNTSVEGNPMRIGGQWHRRGLGTHSPARTVYRLDGRYTALHGAAGQDAETDGTVSFEILVDGRSRWSSGLLRRTDASKPFTVSLAGATELALVVTEGGDTYMGDHADWVNLWLEQADAESKPESQSGGGEH